MREAGIATTPVSVFDLVRRELRYAPQHAGYWQRYLLIIIKSIEKHAQTMHTCPYDNEYPTGEYDMRTTLNIFSDFHSIRLFATMLLCRNNL